MHRGGMTGVVWFTVGHHLLSADRRWVPAILGTPINRHSVLFVQPQNLRYKGLQSQHQLAGAGMGFRPCQETDCYLAWVPSFYLGRSFIMICRTGWGHPGCNLLCSLSLFSCPPAFRAERSTQSSWVFLSVFRKTWGRRPGAAVPPNQEGCHCQKVSMSKHTRGNATML